MAVWDWTGLAEGTDQAGTCMTVISSGVGVNNLKALLETQERTFKPWKASLSE
jgi:hypothetical protein